MSFRQLIMLAIIVGVIGVILYCGLMYLVIRLRRVPATHTMRRVRVILLSMAAIYPAFLLVLSVIHVVAPQRSGLLALTQVLAPFLFTPLVLLLPFAFIYKARVLQVVLLACFAVIAFRLLPPLHFTTPTVATATAQIHVLQWNVNVCCGAERQAARVRPVLAATHADIIILQEAYWEWLRADPSISRRYPYQMNHTREASSGLVVLSRYPILDGAGAPRRPGVRGWPRLVWVRLALGDNQELLLVAAHPESPYSSNGQCRVASCYDTVERDALIPHIRAVIDPALQQDGLILLVGDMNTTEREPAYYELANGLEDTHREVGSGFGTTWGLIPEIGWQTPLLRIEYMFHSTNILPTRMTTDCTPHGSDHCIVEGAFAIK